MTGKPTAWDGSLVCLGDVTFRHPNSPVDSCHTTHSHSHATTTWRCLLRLLRLPTRHQPSLCRYRTLPSHTTFCSGMRRKQPWRWPTWFPGRYDVHVSPLLVGPAVAYGVNEP